MCSRNPPLAPPIAVKPSGGVLVLANDTAVRLVPVKSSARNTIETVFCLRRNHISASALNATSQQMTNGRRVPAERALTNQPKEGEIGQPSPSYSSPAFSGAFFEMPMRSIPVDDIMVFVI